jgi:xanthine/uracil/vitamin C permease (AzgA family)
MSDFQNNLNQLNRIIESKVMVEIPTSVRAGIQIQIGLWIILGFFTFGQLLVDLEVLIWLNSRFLNSNQFINN